MTLDHKGILYHIKVQKPQVLFLYYISVVDKSSTRTEISNLKINVKAFTSTIKDLPNEQAQMFISFYYSEMFVLVIVMSTKNHYYYIKSACSRKFQSHYFSSAACLVDLKTYSAPLHVQVAPSSFVLR